MGKTGNPCDRDSGRVLLRIIPTPRAGGGGGPWYWISISSIHIGDKLVIFSRDFFVRRERVAIRKEMQGTYEAQMQKKWEGSYSRTLICMEKVATT